MARTTDQDIRDQEDLLLIERFDGLIGKVWRTAHIYEEEEFREGTRWRMHPDLYARIMTTRLLVERLIGYRESGEPKIYGIKIDRDLRMPETEIILRWEVKSDG